MLVDKNIFRNDSDVNGGGVAFNVQESLPEPNMELKVKIFELLSLEIAPKHANRFLLFVDIDLQ